MALTEESQQFLTINTHWGLYQYTRLPFDVASTLALFQKVTDEILQGLPIVIFYLDNILVTRASNQEHRKNLEELLARLKKNGLRLKKSKCSFMQSSIIYYKLLQKIHENPTPEPELLQKTWG